MEKLIFSDEFDYDGAPNPEKWRCEVGNHQWANNELQAYSDRPSNVYVKDGKLVIVAQKEKDGDREYTSARLNTKESFTYGTFKISAKLPNGVGSWPAIWMLGKSIREGTRWPLCGEIDIMEHVGRDEDNLLFSLHSEKRNHAIGTERTIVARSKDLCKDFHEYCVKWTPTFIEFFVDDVSMARFDKDDDNSVENWPFDAPHFMILNIAVGGGLGGPVNDEHLPYVMEIDYVRIYAE
ncbi:MAG: glycoside hydrolase family 16 protein [Defluviitaleaceae bacterium]|nr:glycoside hydrolase family 16 protein [Defluviitaleaceae bacterium]